ncbi:MAG: S8 family serine peptidase [Bacteroidetes bacterium]|nr:S8 family serine peptidase [Bacteroidota bacterium]
MKTLLYPILLLLPVLGLATTQSPCEHSEIIVQLKKSESPNRLVMRLQAKWPQANFNLESTISERFQFYLLSQTCDKEKTVGLESLRNDEAIISASWNLKVEPRRDSVPNDPLFPTQWNLDKIRLPEVWSLAQGGPTTSGKEIVAAVIDGGFDLLHQDLQANIWHNPNELLDGMDNDGNGYVDDLYGWNFSADSLYFPFTTNHGTNVLGVIGAEGDNNEGVSGVNWHIKILPLHINYGFNSIGPVIKALEYAITMRELYNDTGGEKGAFIVATNGSFGLDDPVDCATQPVWASLYDTLGALGVLNVVATRNDNFDIDQTGDMPSSCASEYLITVTASDSLDQKLPGVAYGKKTIDLTAPGSSMPTTDLNGKYRAGFSGASAACPHVAGAIALLYSLPCSDLDKLAETDPAAAARLVRDAILKGVDKLPNLKNRTSTGGRLDVYNSMKYLHSYCIAMQKEREAGSFEEDYIGGRDIFSVYPNPVADKLTVEYSIADFQLLRFRVFNILGQEIHYEILEQAKPFEPQILEIDVSGWAAGTYFVNIFDLGKGISAKFVKL